VTHGWIPKAAWGSVVALHLLLAAVMLAMAVPLVWQIPTDLSSDYLPDQYELFIVLLATPIVLAVLILPALDTWLRGRHFWLIGFDLATTLAAWTAFLPFIFASDLPIVAIVLAPVALLLAIVVPSARARSEASS
jgi:hypothetical protein